MFDRVVTITLLCLLPLGCSTGGGNPPPREVSAWHGPVQVHGAFRAMFREGKTSATLTLDTLLPNPDLYAVGALAALSGEITVIAGRAYVSYPEGEETARTEAGPQTDVGATLLVNTEVKTWNSVTTERAFTFEELDDEIARLAAAAGVNVEGRFPFLIQGPVEDLQWHVIDGRRLTGTEKSHREHLAAAVRMKRSRVAATLIGFYSRSDQGVFTHMGSKTHIHCVLDDPLAAGHVDHVNIPAGTTVRFPRAGA